MINYQRICLWLFISLYHKGAKDKSLTSSESHVHPLGLTVLCLVSLGCLSIVSVGVVSNILAGRNTHPH